MAGPATATWREELVSFACEGDQLLGILTRPVGPIDTGLVILPGGWQTRVGAHRQNVLLARSLGERRIATFRFEGRGMGDGDGAHPGFLGLGPDIAAAVAALRAAVDGLDQVILYGLCDAATAIAVELPGSAADGAILLNPWVRSEQTLAAAQIRAHYPRQAFSPVFWKKLLTGQINPMAKLREISSAVATSRQATPGRSLGDRLHAALAADSRPLLVILSGRDMTAAEFEGEVLPRLAKPLPDHLTVARVVEADHTFSQAHCWQEALGHIQEWLARRSATGTAPPPSSS